jgi:aromatic ring-opening dioxygenase catalytic subunit (LigB family)
VADLVGVFAASHGPMIAREWENLPGRVREQLTASFGELGRRIKNVQADVLIVISPDHWVNFFINNLPSVCIGIGEEHDGPPEPFMKAVFPHKTLRGNVGLGSHILETALEDGFDPSISHRLTLDHGFCLPLWRLGLGGDIAIVPMVVNSLETPMPTIKRCIEWGHLLAKAIKSYPERLRVAILATGGLSHSIGEATMGAVDEKFDRSCIQLFTGTPDAEFATSLTDQLRTTGNGAHEVRNWVIAHGAAGSHGFELVDYAPLPEVYVGCALAEWRVRA